MPSEPPVGGVVLTKIPPSEDEYDFQLTSESADLLLAGRPLLLRGRPLGAVTTSQPRWLRQPGMEAIASFP
jgi:hypothetical protein